LATTTNNTGFNSQSQLLFPNIQNEWNNNSNNWFDQVVDFLMLKMYFFVFV